MPPARGVASQKARKRRNRNGEAFPHIRRQSRNKYAYSSESRFLHIGRNKLLTAYCLLLTVLTSHYTSLHSTTFPSISSGRRRHFRLPWTLNPRRGRNRSEAPNRLGRSSDR